MKKEYIIGLVIIIVLIGGYFISNKKGEVKNAEQSIKIGGILALTGSLSFLGQAENNGFAMGVEEINNNGGINGKKIEFIVEDNQGDAKVAVSGVSKLLNVDNVDFVLSAFTHITEAIKETVKSKGVPMLYISSIKSIAESNDLFFRDYFDMGDLSLLMVEKIKDSNYKNVAIFAENGVACNENVEAMKSNLNKNKINIIHTELFNSTDTDYRTQLTKIKNSKPDVIAVCAWRSEPIFMKSLKELGMINIPTIHVVAPFLPPADTEDMRKLYEENKTISTWYFKAEENYNKEQKDFAKKYFEKYKVKATADASYTYDDAHIIANVFKVCDDKGEIKNSRCIIEELLKTNYSGVAGNLSFNEKGVSQRDLSLTRVENGNWVGVK